MRPTEGEMADAAGDEVEGGPAVTSDSPFGLSDYQATWLGPADLATWRPSSRRQGRLEGLQTAPSWT